jgi:penicillin-insensitive murein DD-endopeptidase
MRESNARAGYPVTMRTRWVSLVVFASLLGLAALAVAEPTDAPVKRGWGEQTTPAPGEPAAIGEYSAGCVRGAEVLPLEGPGYQVMHPSRHRHFGHPDLIAFLKRLGQGVRDQKLAPLLVADLSQPRGGRARGGHASHQTGLDVDLWYWAPKQAARRSLTSEERETTKARSILDGKAEAIAKTERARVEALLRLTAADERVARVFVHPWIKRELCSAAGPAAGDRAYLAKMRPWFGHDDHFHVRLHCPKSSPDCVPQPPQPAGDGCDELDYWLSDEAKADRDKGRKEYVKKVITEPKLPAACEALL